MNENHADLKRDTVSERSRCCFAPGGETLAMLDSVLKRSRYRFAGHAEMSANHTFLERVLKRSRCSFAPGGVRK